MKAINQFVPLSFSVYRRQGTQGGPGGGGLCCSWGECHVVSRVQRANESSR